MSGRGAEGGRGVRESLILALMMAAPYLAVVLFWCFGRNAWLAILAYHAQILLWLVVTRPVISFKKPSWSPLALMIVPSVLSAPLLYFVLPLVARIDLSVWLADHRLSGAALFGVVGYYGLVHPVLEQLHWTPLRERTPLAHVAFAGYHMIVLSSLLSLPWLAICFGALAATSFLWQRLTHEAGSLVPVVASHVAADLGMVIVAVLLS
ncbi:MAG: hypothetical protein Q7W51_07785 [Coriobacteriia bacterium]|nr:hypothetical protein [Coriobacteriia bacterium]